jgi:hypothetical protein
LHEEINALSFFVFYRLSIDFQRRMNMVDNKLDEWQQLADAALESGRNGDTRSGLIMLQEGIDRARLAKDTRGEIIAMNAAALMHSIRGDFWASLAGSIDAFFKAQEHHDRLGMAHAMTMLAGALVLMTPDESEIGLLGNALTIAEEEQDVRLQVRIHNLFGILHGDVANFNEAEMHFDLALVLAECDESSLDRWRLTANIANLGRKRAKFAHESGAMDYCADHCNRSLELIARVEAHCLAHGKIPILLDASRIAGMLHVLQDRADLAAGKFTTAWNLALDKKQRSVLPALGLDVARLAIAAGALDDAENTITEALLEAAQTRPSPKAAALHELMAACQHARGDHRGEALSLAAAVSARSEFEALKREARRQIARVLENFLSEAIA